MQNHIHVRFPQLAMAYLKGWIFILFSFCLIPNPGYGQDVLWGLTSNYGPKGAGTAFSLETTGMNFQIRKAFYNPAIYPQGSLVQGTDGAFYGVTLEGGTDNVGTIFKLEADGTFITLKNFNKKDGVNPQGGLVQGSDGAFYGVTRHGGSFGYGTVFKLEADGTFNTLKSFNKTDDGAEPIGVLVQSSDGFFYGVTIVGGSNNYGTVFKISDNGAFTTLKEFSTSNGDGIFPSISLVQGSEGFFLRHDYRWR